MQMVSFIILMIFFFQNNNYHVSEISKRKEMGNEWLMESYKGLAGV